MLKIYLKTIKRIIRSNDAEHCVDHKSFYVIAEEEDAQPHTKEYNLYDDELLNAFYPLSYRDRKHGRVVHICASDGYLKFKQWKEPDAKLIEYVSYKEHICSMNELYRLPADKVIAYLRQEGLSCHLTK